MELIKVVRPQVLIGLVGASGCSRRSPGDGHNGSLLSPASRQAVILRRRIAVLGVTSTMGGLRQCALQPAVVFAVLPLWRLPSLSRTHRRPGAAGKAIHV